MTPTKLNHNDTVKVLGRNGQGKGRAHEDQLFYVFTIKTYVVGPNSHLVRWGNTHLVQRLEKEIQAARERGESLASLIPVSGAIYGPGYEAQREADRKRLESAVVLHVGDSVEIEGRTYTVHAAWNNNADLVEVQ